MNYDESEMADLRFVKVLFLQKHNKRFTKRMRKIWQKLLFSVIEGKTEP